MKPLITVLFVFLLGQFCTAQDKIDHEENPYSYSNVLKLSPFELGSAQFQIGYERYFKNRAQSVVILPSVFIGRKGEETRNGYQLMAQYRFYLSQLQRESNETLNMYNIGFYAAPYILGISHTEVYSYGVSDPVTFEYKMDLMEEKVKAMEGGALMGIQLDITKRIVLDFFVGGGIRESQVSKNKPDEGNINYGILDLGYSGVKPRIGLQMGITF